MKISLYAVGKLRSGPQADLIADFQKRIRGSGPALGIADFLIREFEAPKGLTGPKRQEREGALLLDAVPKGAKNIALDERGQNISSMALKDLVRDWRDDGVKDLVFFIGGANGHAPKLLQSADKKISFGAATWPHMLVRVMLCEQIYRTLTILSGSPYHRE